MHADTAVVGQAVIDQAYRQIVDHTALGMAISQQRVFVYANAHLAHLLGLDEPAQLMGRSSTEFIHPEDQERLQVIAARIYASQPLSEPLRFQIVRADGHTICVEAVGIPIRYEGIESQLVYYLDITSWQEAECQRNDMQTLLRDALEATPDLMSIIDPDLRIVLSNWHGHDYIPAAQRHAGAFCYRVLAQRDTPCENCHVLQVFHTGQAAHATYANAVDGRTRELSAYPILDATGKVVRVLDRSHDITSRQRAQEALRESEEKYRQIFELESDAMFLIDSGSGQILEANAAASAMYGYSHDKLLHMNHTELSAQPNETRRAALEGVTSIPYRLHRKRDGGIIHVEIAARHLIWHGRPVHIASIRDADERLRQQEAVWQTKLLVEHSPVVLFRWRAEDGWAVDFVSDNVHNLGYNAAELRSRATPYASLVYPLDWPRILAEAQPCLTGQKSACQRQYRLLTPDGGLRWVEDHIAWTRGASDTPGFFEGVVTDITERKELEESFIRAQKMESVGRLAGGIAHDFNNVLTAISGYTGLARLHLPEDHPAQAELDQVLRGADRAATLTRQLLTFSRHQILELSVLNLNDLVQNLSSFLARLIGEDIELQLKLAPDLGLIKVNPSQIEQVLTNLAINARDAMPTGGQLTIETRNVLLPTRHMPRNLNAPNGTCVQLSVRDTGTGMSDEVRSHLFEPFFTTKSPDKGTGLGLATAYSIVMQHGGTIEASSKLGHGSTFRIRLPQTTATAPSAPAVEEAPPRAATRVCNETVLVVEDEPAVRDLTVRLLQRLGYHVLEATNGPDALRAAAAFDKHIDVLLSDMVMPQMGGRELARQLVALQPDLRVLFVSGYAADADTNTAPLPANAGFLQKPFTSQSLSRKLREVLDGPLTP